MDNGALNLLFDWLQEHPLLGLSLVFLVAFGESLAVVGLLVPGAILMVAFGALVALGYLPLGATLLSAILGAVAGDGLSFWLGSHYEQALARRWPFTRHPELLQRGRQYFERHGGKSILLGRFVGPLRPIIPAVAGMLHMSTRQFLLINILSALLWAPVYLLPGLVFGASLELASEFAGRFTLLLVSLLLGLWFIGWLVRQLYLWLVPLSDRIFARLMNWSRRHPLAGEIPAAIFTPGHPEVRGLSLLALLLLLTTAGFILLTRYAHLLPLMQNLNRLLFHSLQGLRNPPFDWFMTFVTSLGDTPLLLGIVLVTAAFLLWRRNLLALWHWLAAFALPWLMVKLLHHFYAQSPPPGLNPVEGLSYPAGHATLATGVYGFLAILLTREMRPLHRLPMYVVTVLLVMLIAFSRLYLGAQWLSDVLAGLLLGLAWTALLGIAYRRHATANGFLRRDRFWLSGLIVLLMLAYSFSVQPDKLQRFAPLSQPYVMGRAAWLDTGWQLLPALREDLRGHNRLPFNLQWLGTEQAIRGSLRQAGWQAVRNDWRDYLRWLNPDAEPADLPVLPHVHNGSYDRLRFVRQSGPGLYLAIRLWPADIRIQDANGQQPLWYGNVTRLDKTDLYGLHFLVTARDFETPVEWLRAHPPGARIVGLRQRQIEMQARVLRFPVMLLESGPAAGP